MKYEAPSLASVACKAGGMAVRTVLRPRPGQAVGAALVGCAAAAAATYVALAYALPPLTAAARATASATARCVLGGLAAPAAAPAVAPAAASLTVNGNPQLCTRAPHTRPTFNMSTITTAGPCSALVVRGTQAPQAVTWVASPCLALDWAAVQPTRIVIFCDPLAQLRPGHGPEPNLQPPARLALPRPAMQMLLLLPPPPLPPPHTQCSESAAAVAVPLALALALVQRRPVTVTRCLQPAQVLSRPALSLYSCSEVGCVVAV